METKFKPQIKILEGLNEFSFGTSREQVVKLLGEPDLAQDLNDEIIGSRTEVYHFNRLGLSLFFDSIRNNSLYSVETTNIESVLYDIPVFHLSEKELTALMKKHGFVLTETENHAWGEKRLSFDKASFDCYYQANRMVSLTFGVNEAEGDYTFTSN